MDDHDRYRMDGTDRLDVEPPRPVPGANSRCDPLDHYQHEAARMREKADREFLQYTLLLARVRAELKAEAEAGAAT